MLEFARQADVCRRRFGHGLLRGLDGKGTSGSVRGGWEHQLVHPWDQEEESARMKLETREADAGDRGIPYRMRDIGDFKVQRSFCRRHRPDNFVD